MDLQRKLELLERADLSQWRKSQRAKAAGLPVSGIAGLGNLLLAIAGPVSNLGAGINLGAVERLTEAYKAIRADYETIPFEEMDKEDEDFRFLFEYRHKINELEGKIEAFVAKVEQNNGIGQSEWPEYQELWSAIKGLMSNNYRSIVLEKYGMAYGNNRRFPEA